MTVLSICQINYNMWRTFNEETAKQYLEEQLNNLVEKIA